MNRSSCTAPFKGVAITTISLELYARLKRLHGTVREPEEFIKSEARDTDGRLDPRYYEAQQLWFNYRLTHMQRALGRMSHDRRA